MLEPMRTLYLTGGPNEPGAELLRTGAAGCAWLDADGAFELDTRVRLSSNSTHAMFGHGVVEELNALPIEGSLGGGLEALIPPAHLDRVRSLFFEADRKTYGATYEFVVGTADAPEPVEYRVRIDNREYQATLSHLTFLMSVASREGLAVWMRL